MRTWLVMSLVLLNAYSVGANSVERFVNYQSWPKLANANFGPYHRSQQPWIWAFVVAPLIAALLLAVALLTSSRSDEPAWPLWTVVAASVVGFLSTAVLQLPLHRKLDHGYSEVLVRKLLKTDWIRKAADLVRIIAVIALLCGDMRRS